MLKKIIVFTLLTFYSMLAFAQEEKDKKETNKQVETQAMSMSKLKEYYGSWFYMPPFQISLKSTAGYNLYDIYKAQYLKLGLGNDYLISQDGIRFQVTGYDKSIFDIEPKVDSNHNLSFKAKASIENQSKSAYLTIIAILK